MQLAVELNKLTQTPYIGIWSEGELIHCFDCWRDVSVFIHELLDQAQQAWPSEEKIV